MIKTLFKGEFNKFLKEGTAYPKSFPGAKAKQLIMQVQFCQSIIMMLPSPMLELTIC